jgi:alpha-ketoglutarate-dependent 2,4-dichlorophenoxyacetate dioxygenase
MSLEFRPLHPLFAAEVHGVDTAERLDVETLATMWEGINRYAVLVIPGQRLSADQEVAFAEHFGTLETYTHSYRSGEQPRHRLEIADQSNLTTDDKLRELSDRRRFRSLANRLWHTDSSFKRVPGMLSMLHAHVVPPVGGETEFADLRAAYDALSADMKTQIRDLVAEHEYAHSRATVGFGDFNAEERAMLPPVPQRIVRTHAGSKRKTLYLASHAFRILGMPVPEGRMLLMDLIEHATQREFIYRHSWKVGDLVIWDNRCTMHRGRPYDDAKHVRDLRRVTTSDVASTLEQEPIPIPLPMPA